MVELITAEKAAQISVENLLKNEEILAICKEFENDILLACKKGKFSIEFTTELDDEKRQKYELALFQVLSKKGFIIDMTEVSPSLYAIVKPYKIKICWK